MKWNPVCSACVDDPVTEKPHSQAMRDLVDLLSEMKVGVRGGQVTARVIVKEVEAGRAQRQDPCEKFRWLEIDVGTYATLDDAELSDSRGSQERNEPDPLLALMPQTLGYGGQRASGSVAWGGALVCFERGFHEVVGIPPCEIKGGQQPGLVGMSETWNAIEERGGRALGGEKEGLLAESFGEAFACSLKDGISDVEGASISLASPDEHGKTLPQAEAGRALSKATFTGAFIRLEFLDHGVGAVQGLSRENAACAPVLARTPDFATETGTSQKKVSLTFLRCIALSGYLAEGDAPRIKKVSDT